MTFSTNVFYTEGKGNIAATINAVVRFADVYGIRKVILFAASAENVLRVRERVSHETQVIAVTFPAEMAAEHDGNYFFIGMPSAKDRSLLRDAQVRLLQGVMPFRAFGSPSNETKSVLATLGLFGGGMELCVQATLMACDAGAVEEGERCIAMCADTAIMARAGHAWRFLSEHSRFVIEHLICKPINYDISRPSSVVALELPGEITIPAINAEEPPSLSSAEPEDPSQD